MPDQPHRSPNHFPNHSPSQSSGPPDADMEPPPGYVSHLFSQPLDCSKPSSTFILIPEDVKTAVDEARAQEYQRRIEEREKERQREEEKNRNLERIAAIKIREAEMAALAAGTAGTAKGGRGMNAGALEADDDADHPDDFDVDDESGVEKRPELRYPIYTDAALHAFKTRTQSMSPDKDLRKRDEEVARLLQAKGNERLVGTPESPTEAMENLRLCMPHFGEVIDFIRDHLVLAAFSGKSCRLPPMLLGGEPGIGKTHFAHLLAEVLGTAVHRISFDKAVTGPTLTGSERRWANSAYGLVFEAVCLGQHANPVIVLDEIDKADQRRDWNALAPLHSLLEPVTAKRSKDISLDFEFDCSQVTWIATANRLDQIVDSLRSRFQIFTIERPDARAALEATRWVVESVFNELALPNFEPPARFLAVQLAHLTAREVQQATRKAIARAVADGRRRVTLADLPDGLGHDDSEGGRNGRTGSGSSGKDWLH